MTILQGQVRRRIIPTSIPAVTIAGPSFSTPRFRRGMAVALIAASGVIMPPLVPRPVPAPTVDRYLIPLSEPVRLSKKIGIKAPWAPYESNVLGLFTAEPTSEDKWHQPWSEPVRFKRDPHASVALITSGERWTPQPDYTRGLEPPWHYAWSEPVRVKPRLTTGSQPFDAELHPTPVVSFSYYNWLAEPVRFKKIHVSVIASGGIWTAQPSTFYPGADNEAPWHYPWSEPKRFKPALTGALQAPYQAWPLPLDAIFPGPTVEAAWHYAWSEPVRFKSIKVSAIASGLIWTPQPSTFYPGADNEAPWHQPWSEPKRFKPRLQVGLNPFEFFPLDNPQVTFSYYNWWSEPRRFKRGLAVQLQRALFEDTANTTLPKRSPVWFTPLSEPKRFPKRLHAALNPFDMLQVPVVPAADDYIGWYAPISEPVRVPVGLKAWLQMSTAWPPRLLPTPDITAVLDATEVNSDQAEIVYIVAGAASSAKVSIIEGPRSASALSIRES